MAAVYGCGPLLPRVGRSRSASVLWLAALGVVWLVLLLTPDGVWLAFPLFFLRPHLLPGWPGLVVAATTALAIAGFALHQQMITAAAVIGPHRYGCSAALPGRGSGSTAEPLVTSDAIPASLH